MLGDSNDPRKQMGEVVESPGKKMACVQPLLDWSIPKVYEAQQEK